MKNLHCFIIALLIASATFAQAKSYLIIENPNGIAAGCLDSAQLNNAAAVKRVTIYPNPTKGHFTVNVENAENSLVLEIYNLIGERVYRTFIYPDKTEMNLSGRAAGLYFYRVTTEDGIVVAAGKLVIE